MADTPDSKLETIISTTTQVAEDYLCEGNTPLCKILIENLLDLYAKLEKTNQFDNKESKYRLILGYIKVLTLESITNLKYVRDPNDLSWRFYGYIRDGITQLPMPELFLIFSMNMRPGEQPITGKKVYENLTYHGKKITAQLRTEFEKWFDYVHAITRYFDTLKTGALKGRDLNDKEKSTIDEFKQKFGLTEKLYVNENPEKRLTYKPQ